MSSSGVRAYVLPRPCSWRSPDVTNDATTSILSWRMLGVALAVALTYLTLASGVALAGLLGALQVGALAGVAGGLVAPSWRVAILAAAAGLLVGVAVSPPWFNQGQPITIVVMFLVGVSVAAGVQAVVSSGQLRASVIVAFALALLVAGVWLVATSIAQVPHQRDQGRTVLQELARRPVAGQRWDDSEFYRAVVWKMREGTPFLEAFRAAYRENSRWRSDPTSVLGVRPALMFEFWKALPGWPQDALWSLVALGSVAMMAAPIVVSRSVSPGLGIAGAGGLAAYLLGYALIPSLLFLSEIWTGVLAVLVLAAYRMSQENGDGRAWMASAAAVALLAALTRELMVFLLIAGIAAAWFGPAERRRFDLAVWAAAFVVFCGVWGAHLLAARSIVTAVAGTGFVWFAHGGLGNLVSGMVSSTWSVGNSWVPVVLALLGLVGAFAQADRQFRVFALAALVMPLIGFVFVGTDAVLGATGVAYNYWGAIVMPSLFVLAPASLALVPGMRQVPSVTGADGRAA